jgi:hypothetical protein
VDAESLRRGAGGGLLFAPVLTVVGGHALHHHRRHLQPIHSMLPNQLHPPGHRAETATSATAARAMREPAAGTVVEPPPVVGCVGQQ